MNNDKKILNFIKIKKTQIEMISDRGYIIENNELLLYNIISSNISNGEKINYFKNIYSDRMNLSNLYYSNDKSSTILVYYAEDKKTTDSSLGVSDIKEMILFYTKCNPNYVILITEVPLTPLAKQSLKSDCITDIKVFMDADLYFNLTKHIFYNNHILLTDEETKSLINNIKIKLSMLPIIKSNDPVIKYFNYPSGHVVKIIRKGLFLDSVNLTSVYYRLIL